MKRRKLSYRIHDPNPPEVTAEVALKIFIQVNMAKVEAAIQCELDNLTQTTVKPFLVWNSTASLSATFTSNAPPMASVCAG